MATLSSTTGWTLTGKVSLLSVIGRSLKKIKLFTMATLLVMFRLVLVVSGLGFVCAAAWFVAMPLGLLTIGISLLLLEWVVKR